MVRWLVSVALALAMVALVGYVAASIVVYERLSKVSGDCPAAFAANRPESFSVPAPFTLDPTPWFMPSPREVTIPSRDAGIELAGWWLPAERADAPAVVVVHGLAACRRDHTVLLPAGMLRRNGMSVLIIDYRDHGDATYEDG